MREQGVLDAFAEWGAFIPILNAEYWMAAVYDSSP